MNKENVYRYEIHGIWKSEVIQSCPALCDPMDCSLLGFLVFHCFQEFAQTHLSKVHQVSDAIQPSHPLLPFLLLSSFPASRSFPVSHIFASGGQSIEASASTSVFPMNIKDWFPLGLTGLISLLPMGISSLLQHHNLKASILWLSAFFMVQVSHPYKVIVYISWNRGPRSK